MKVTKKLKSWNGTVPFFLRRLGIQHVLKRMLTLTYARSAAGRPARHSAWFMKNKENVNSIGQKIPAFLKENNRVLWSGLSVWNISRIPIFYFQKMRKILDHKWNLDTTKALHTSRGISKRQRYVGIFIVQT